MMHLTTLLKTVAVVGTMMGMVKADAPRHIIAGTGDNLVESGGFIETGEYYGGNNGGGRKGGYHRHGGDYYNDYDGGDDYDNEGDDDYHYGKHGRKVVKRTIFIDGCTGKPYPDQDYTHPEGFVIPPSPALPSPALPSPWAGAPSTVTVTSGEDIYALDPTELHEQLKQMSDWIE